MKLEGATIGVANATIGVAIKKELSPMLQSCVEDDCCEPRLRKAMSSGVLDNAESWPCPKCGCEWKASVIGEGVGAVKHWRPYGYIEIW